MTGIPDAEVLKKRWDSLEHRAQGGSREARPGRSAARGAASIRERTGLQVRPHSPAVYEHLHLLSGYSKEQVGLISPCPWREFAAGRYDNECEKVTRRRGQKCREKPRVSVCGQGKA